MDVFNMLAAASSSGCFAAAGVGALAHTQRRCTPQLVASAALYGTSNSLALERQLQRGSWRRRRLSSLRQAGRGARLQLPRGPQ
jgi:hydroxyethylthiazole kinase-like sugar kinase family protein